MSEQEAQGAGSAADGVLTSAPYFTSIDSEANDGYISAYEEEYGTDTTPNFVAEAAYWSVLMTEQALTESGSDVSSGQEIKTALENEITVEAPQGPVTMNPDNHHATLQSRVGEYNADSGSFDILTEFGQIEPSGLTVAGSCLSE
jgi:ABC-type branched-subunit amino acid transport system substrate-binding protein